MKARVIAVLAVMTVALGAASAAQAVAINPVAYAGSPGAWQASGGGALGGAYDLYCSGTNAFSSGRSMTLYPQKVGPSPKNASSQDVYMQAYTEFSLDGRTWYRGPSSAWQKRTIDSWFPTTTFDQADIDITSWVKYYGKAIWRVRAEFRWYTKPATAASWLGTATTGYTFGQAYGNVLTAGNLNSTGEFACVLN